MNTFAEQLVSKVSPFHVLKHPFYRAWTAGKLEKESLQHYAEQYHHHVEAFPRYISATHSLTADLKTRQMLLENLVDEEKGDENHPELWLQFGEGLGQSREATLKSSPTEKTKKLVDTFMGLSRSSAEEGLGALYAYEHQVPEVAKVKIEGLKEFYGINDERTLKFFEVHKTADVYHSQAVAEIMENMTDAQKQKVEAAALEAAKALWSFLSGVCESCSQDFSAFENCVAA